MTVLCAWNTLAPDIHMSNFSTFSKSLFKSYLRTCSSHYHFTHALINTLTQLYFSICSSTVFYHFRTTQICIKFYYIVFIVYYLFHLA